MSSGLGPDTAGGVGGRGVDKWRGLAGQLLHQDIEALQQHLPLLTAEPVECSLEWLEVSVHHLENLVGSALPDRYQGAAVVGRVLSALQQSSVSQLGDDQAGSSQGHAEPLGQSRHAQGSMEYNLGEGSNVARRQRSPSS